MTSTDFIIKKLKEIHNLFKSSNIRYEFDSFCKTHLIEITPLEFYNSENYINAELEFEDLFALKFPSEEIVFISDDSLNKINDPIFEIYSYKTGTLLADFNVLSDLVLFNEITDNVYQNAGENNYALAA